MIARVLDAAQIVEATKAVAVRTWNSNGPLPDEGRIAELAGVTHGSTEQILYEIGDRLNTILGQSLVTRDWFIFDGEMSTQISHG